MHVKRELAKAGCAWQAVTIVPHTLVRNSSDVFLVLAQARFAFVGVQGVFSPSKNSWLFSFDAPWSWIVVTDIREWYFIQTEWGVYEQHPEKYGYIEARCLNSEMPHVPAVAEALVQTGRHKLTISDRDALCNVLEAPPASGPFYDLSLIHI